MHHSLLGAGRTTHLKIVALSLAGAIVVVLIGLNARGDRRCKHRRSRQSGTAGDVCRTGELVNPLTHLASPRALHCSHPVSDRDGVTRSFTTR